MTDAIPFTYIIRSNNRYSGTPVNCSVLLRGLPTQFREFQCEVLGFWCMILNAGGNTIINQAVNPPYASYNYLELVSSNLPFCDGWDTRGSSMRLVGNSLCNSGNNMPFRVSNFNGQYINFQVLDENGANSMNVNDWVVVIKMTGLQ